MTKSDKHNSLFYSRAVYYIFKGGPEPYCPYEKVLKSFQATCLIKKCLLNYGWKCVKVLDDVHTR